MNEQRLTAYLDLIQKLLACPQGKELALLQSNQAIVDLEFVQMMERVAAQLAAEGDPGSASFLHTWAEELKNALAQPPGDIKAPPTGDRTTAYMDLIKELLSCRKGTESEVLKANWNLVDAGLVQQMRQVAAMLAEKGDHADANFLAGLAQQFSGTTAHHDSAQRTFFEQVLQTIQHSGGDLKAVYPLLQENIAYLDESFVPMMQIWAEETLPAIDPQQSLQLAADLVIFADLIQQLPQEQPANQLEIALTSYQIALPLFPPDSFPQQWAMIQKHMGEAYCQRLKGDKAENLEVAIHCLHDALQVYSRDTFPHEWVLVQKDLGEAYRHRIQGDRTENLEQAVAAYAAAWQVAQPN